MSRSDLLLSIIIPVYNVEKYIDKCLKSCYDQTFTKNYEIIIVNDGTKDRSMDIVATYVSKYDNIIIVNKVNGGLSSARNEGLKHASGEYIWFVDSDDTIIDCSIETIIKNIRDYHNDMLFYDIIKVKESNKCESLRKMYKTSSPTTYLGWKWFIEGIYMWPMAQMYVINKQFLEENNLLFKEGILHEDVEFKFRALIYAKDVTYIPQALYYYLIRENGSISSNYNPKRLVDLRNIVCSEIEIINLLEDDNKRKAASFALYRNFEYFVSFALNNNVSDQESNIYEVFLKVKKPLREALFIAPFRYKMKIALALCNFSIFKLYLRR